MSEDEIKRSGGVLRKGGHRKGSSGEHPVMQAVRKKLDSIREGTLPELEALNARIDRLKVKSDPPLEKEVMIPAEEEVMIPINEGEDDTIPGIGTQIVKPEEERKT